jgi:hypothetical protein
MRKGETKRIFETTNSRAKSGCGGGFSQNFEQNVIIIFVEPLPKNADSRHFTPNPKRNCIGGAFVELSATVTASS